MYVQRVSFYPALGKAFELRAALEDRVKARQAQGLHMGLQERIASSDGALFTLVIMHRSLADLEELRRRNLTDDAFRAFVTKASSLSIKQPTTELAEVLVPLPR